MSSKTFSIVTLFLLAFLQIVQSLILSYFMIWIHGAILVFFPLLDGALLIYVLFSYNIAFAATTGGVTWLLYSWLLLGKLIYYFFFVFDDPNALVGNPLIGSAGINIALYLAPTIFGILAFRSRDQLYGSDSQRISIMTMLHTDMVVHVLLDLLDLMIAYNNSCLPQAIALRTPSLKIVLICFICLAVFMHAYSFPTSAGSSDPRLQAHQGDVFLTRRHAAIVAMFFVDLPLLVIRLYLWINYPSIPGFDPLIVKNLCFLPIQAFRLNQCRLAEREAALSSQKRLHVDESDSATPLMDATNSKSVAISTTAAGGGATPPTFNQTHQAGSTLHGRALPPLQGVAAPHPTATWATGQHPGAESVLSPTSKVRQRRRGSVSSQARLFGTAATGGVASASKRDRKDKTGGGDSRRSRSAFSRSFSGYMAGADGKAMSGIGNEDSPANASPRPAAATRTGVLAAPPPRLQQQGTSHYQPPEDERMSEEGDESVEAAGAVSSATAGQPPSAVGGLDAAVAAKVRERTAPGLGDKNSRLLDDTIAELKSVRGVPIEGFRTRDVFHKIFQCMRVGGSHSMSAILDEHLVLGYWTQIRLSLPIVLQWASQICLIAIGAREELLNPFGLFSVRNFSDIPTDIFVSYCLSAGGLVAMFLIFVGMAPIADVIFLAFFWAVRLTSFYTTFHIVRDTRVFAMAGWIPAQYDWILVVCVFAIKPCVHLLNSLFVLQGAMLGRRHIFFVYNGADKNASVATKAANFDGGSLEQQNMARRGDERGWVTTSSLLVFKNVRHLLVPMSFGELLIGPDLIKAIRLIDGLLLRSWLELLFVFWLKFACLCLFFDWSYLVFFAVHMFFSIIYIVFGQAVRLLALRRFELKALFVDIVKRWSAYEGHGISDKLDEDDGEVPRSTGQLPRHTERASDLSVGEVEFLTVNDVMSRYQRQGFFASPGDLMPSL